MAEVYCEDCEHVHPATKAKPEETWRCLRVKLQTEGVPGVTRERRVAFDPPYHLCRKVNHDCMCPLFEPTRQLTKEAV